MAEEKLLDEGLLKFLVCPEDKGSLEYVPDSGVLYNPRLRKSYPIKNGIPVMLVEQAVVVGDELHKEYLSNARSTSDSAD